MDRGAWLALAVVGLYWGSVGFGLWKVDRETRRGLLPIAVFAMLAALVVGILVYAVSKGDLR